MGRLPLRSCPGQARAADARPVFGLPDRRLAARLPSPKASGCAWRAWAAAPWSPRRARAGIAPASRFSPPGRRGTSQQFVPPVTVPAAAPPRAPTGSWGGSHVLAQRSAPCYDDHGRACSRRRTPCARTSGRGGCAMTRPLIRASVVTGVGRAVLAGALVAGVLTGAAPASGGPPGKIRGYWAEIRRASYGVPHITAADFASLGFGVGRVQAEDNICVIAEKIVTVDATRSLYFGVTGPNDPNVRSDLFFQKAKDDRVVERFLAGAPDGVHAPSRAARDLVRGSARSTSWICGVRAGPAWCGPAPARCWTASSPRYRRPPRRPPPPAPPVPRTWWPLSTGPPRVPAATPTVLAARRPWTAPGWSWPTRTSRGTAPSGSTGCTCASPAGTTWRARRSSATRSSRSGTTPRWAGATPSRPRAGS